MVTIEKRRIPGFAPGLLTLVGVLAAYGVCASVTNHGGTGTLPGRSSNGSGGSSVPSVLTQDYDVSRSGANLAETILTTSNVASSTFGKLFAYPVDEEVFAQPLYVPGLTVGGASHNVVFIATMGNSVYAFDADNSATSSTPLWSVNLGAGIPSSRYLFASGSGVSRNGIYSTPVIDPTSNTIYVVTHLWNTAAQSVSIELHALDVTTGSEKFGAPVTLAAPGFDAVANEQRAGLLLLNGIVYVGLASHADIRTNLTNLKQEPYLGMVLAYNAQTLAQTGAFFPDEGGQGGSVWQGGRGLATDGSYIYTMIANAFTPGTPDYSQSFVQLNPGTLTVAGYYQDPDSACMNTLDLDLSAAGPQIIPGSGTNLLVGGGKEAKVYVLPLSGPLNTQTPAYFWGTSNHPTLPAEGGNCVDNRKGADGWLQGSDTAFFNNPSGPAYWYAFGNNNDLMSWQVSGNTFTPTSVDTPANSATNALAVSANGGAGAILWTVSRRGLGPAVVSAYNAEPSGGHLGLLWNSSQVAARDALGMMGRYSVPTIVNGKVYVATGSNQVAVYGLLPQSSAVVVTPASATETFTALDTKGQLINVNSVGGYTGTVSLTLTGLPPGMTYSFSRGGVKLTATATTATSELSINPAGAVLPLNDDYTVLVTASGTGGITAYAPIRLQIRDAVVTSVMRGACNSSNQLSVSLTYKTSGSAAPSIWIQDPTTPDFPGRLWIDPVPDSGTETTGYWIDNKTQHYFYWFMDQSAGAAANFDNALGFDSLARFYNCK